MAMKRIEFHFHTKESSPCGKIEAMEGVKMFQKAGYDAIVITDHFSTEVLGDEKDHSWEEVKETFLKGYRNAKRASEQLGNIRVYLGMEIRFPGNENDILVYGMKENFLDQYPWLYTKDLETLYHIAEKENILLIQAHPYRDGCYLENVNFLHGVEVYNANPRHQSHNEKAFQAAEKYHMLQTVGSDFHRLEDLSGVCGRIEEVPEDEALLAEAIRKGKIEMTYLM